MGGQRYSHNPMAGEHGPVVSPLTSACMGGVRERGRRGEGRQKERRGGEMGGEMKEEMRKGRVYYQRLRIPEPLRRARLILILRNRCVH